MKIKESIGIGRRKTAVASVRVRKGSGKWKINGRELDKYFFSDNQRQIVESPLKVAGSLGKYDILVNAKGGGLVAQCEAVRLGLSRALIQENEDLQRSFKELGFLTRDSRKKERKKYGLAGARKNFQFSKR